MKRNIQIKKLLLKKRLLERLVSVLGKIKITVSRIDTTINQKAHDWCNGNYGLKEFMPPFNTYESAKLEYHIFTCTAENGDKAFYMQYLPADCDDRLHLFDPEKYADIGLPLRVSVNDITWGSLPKEMKLHSYENISDYNNAIVDLLIELGYGLKNHYEWDEKELELRKKLNLSMEQVDWEDSLRQSKYPLEYNTDEICIGNTVKHVLGLFRDALISDFEIEREKEKEKENENGK